MHCPGRIRGLLISRRIKHFVRVKAFFFLTRRNFSYANTLSEHINNIMLLLQMAIAPPYLNALKFNSV